MVEGSDVLLAGAALGGAYLVSRSGGGAVPELPPLDITLPSPPQTPTVIPAGGGGGGGDGFGSGMAAALFGEVGRLRGRLEEQTDRATGGAGGLSPESLALLLREQTRDITDRVEDTTGNVRDRVDPTANGGGGGGGSPGGLVGVLQESQSTGRGFGEAAGSAWRTIFGETPGRPGEGQAGLLETGAAGWRLLGTGETVDPRTGMTRELEVPGINRPLFEGPIFGEGAGPTMAEELRPAAERAAAPVEGGSFTGYGDLSSITDPTRDTQAELSDATRDRLADWDVYMT